ncbi:MAG: signal peptidase II [Planctomycetota bacterium]|nr:signal peptidase II [Planctomycetota bacterium]
MKRPFVSFLLLAGVLLMVDLSSKSLAFARVAGEPVDLSSIEGRAEAIPAHDPVVAVPKLLAFRLTLNRGAVFGLGQGGVALLAVVSAAAAIVVFIMGYRLPPEALHRRALLAMILAGALGNLWDRVMYDAVRDLFLLFPGVNLPFGWSWPGGATGLYPWIFNAADVYLVLALGAFAFGFDQPRTKQQEST